MKHLQPLYAFGGTYTDVKALMWGRGRLLTEVSWTSPLLPYIRFLWVHDQLNHQLKRLSDPISLDILICMGSSLLTSSRGPDFDKGEK